MEKLHKMKLLFSITTVFMFLGFTVGSYGQALVYVSSTQTEPLAVGEQIHLNIQITEGSSVSGYELTVGFDPTALRYVEGGNADYLPAGAFTIPPIVTENTVYMTATSGVNVALAREGALATLTFEIIAVKGSTIELMDVILSDSAGMPLAVTARNGHIVATELPIDSDVNEDGRVNILDLTLVASNLNVDAPANPRVDVNRDGNVNILDLVLVAQNLDAGGNEDEPEIRVKLVVPTFPLLVSAIPTSGSLIAANATITITFDNDPGDVTASAGSVAGSGKTRTISGPFTPGALSLTLTWTNGDRSHTLGYNVTVPDTTREEPAVVSRPPIDYAAEKKAIQEAYNTFYKAFNDFDISAVQETFDTGNVQFGTIFAGNEPVPVATGWHNIKVNILGLWNGIGTKGNKWGQNSNLSKVWIRYKGSSLEACALGYNCYKGTYPGETHIYLVKKKDQWLINQLDSVTQQNIAIFGLDNAADPRIEKFFARGSDDKEDLAE